MFKLVIQDDEGKTTVVPLIRDEITIGRKEGNTIRLTERNVSRRHARIVRNNGEVSIEDLGSYNGIRVNNARIAERVALRVSDQVQIGDYKLYLKAEGVEHDEARTMPIERLEGSNPPVVPGPAATEQMPVASATPTAQGPAVAPTPIPGSLGTARLVGNPNQTLVAVADTDPQGRPVASQATISALTATPGYGRLVVLSSNFAGKEFELSRPQMIIGRTPENDLVIDHRSISRNHAKVVREPDTGRYTISDLQSSNGVRVNNQDYGKVELRRGDVIDLGHVRLRYIEPGEDFVFSRDAVITDVPETGSKKGVYLFVGLAILALAFAVVWILRDSGSGSGGGGASGGTNGNVTAPTDSSAIVSNNVLVDAAGATPPPTIDAGGVSNTTLMERVDECTKIAQEATRNAARNADWNKLSDCGQALKSLDQARGAQFAEQAVREMRNEAAKSEIESWIKNGELVKARAKVETFDPTSAYLTVVRGLLDRKEDEVVEGLAAKLRKNKECGPYKAAQRDYERFGGNIIQRAINKVGPCVATVEPPPPKTCAEIKCEAGFECKKGECVKKPVVVEASICDNKENVEKIYASAKDAYNIGQFASALAQFESIYKCKQGVGREAYVAACNAQNATKAKFYFRLLGSPTSLVASCLNKQIDPRL